MFAALLLTLTAIQIAHAEAPSAPMVRAVRPVERRVIEWDTYTGRFQAVEDVEIRARVSGYLAAREFSEGQLVEKDQVLFRIDRRPFEVALRESRADLERARTDLALAEVELTRGERLGGARAIAEETLDERRAARNAARAGVTAAEARVAAAELDLSFTELRSPVAGRVSDSLVDVGNLVTGGDAGATLLATVVSLDPIEFVFEASEIEFLKYARLDRSGERPSSRTVRTPVELRLLDEDAWAHRGEMTFVDNRISRSTGTLRAKATFANPDGLLQPGLFGTLRIPGSGAYLALQIPDKAVLADQDTRVVMTVDAEGRVVPRRVELGPLIDGLRVVRSGIGVADLVIIEGLLKARPGGRVQVELSPFPDAGEPAARP